MNRLRPAHIFFIVMCLLAAPSSNAGVISTVHNLSVSGPGEIKSQNETQVCIFCHATHVPNAQVPLWNREVPNLQYTVYKSATMRNRAGQPDGASKLCLSCHDGTIALGKVLNRPEAIKMGGAGSRGEIPSSRRSNLGSDLSGAHPISIPFDDAVARERNAQRGKVIGVESTLNVRGAVAKDLLDPAGKVQCTTCHDPHEDRYYQKDVTPHFWRRASVSEVCENCHLW